MWYSEASYLVLSLACDGLIETPEELSKIKFTIDHLDHLDRDHVITTIMWSPQSLWSFDDQDHHDHVIITTIVDLDYSSCLNHCFYHFVSSSNSRSYIFGCYLLLFLKVDLIDQSHKFLLYWWQLHQLSIGPTPRNMYLVVSRTSHYFQFECFWLLRFAHSQAHLHFEHISIVVLIPTSIYYF